MDVLGILRTLRLARSYDRLASWGAEGGGEERGTCVGWVPLGRAGSSAAGLTAGPWSLDSWLDRWDWPCPEDFSSSPEVETGPVRRDSEES